MPEDEVDTKPVLYGRHASPFVRRVAVTLRLYGIDYDHVPLMPFGPDRRNWRPSIRLRRCRR